MNAFVDNLSDVFARFGTVQARRMFGGYGIYRDGLMFGLVADDVLYLKADEHSLEAFIALKLSPFVYIKNNKPVSLSYYAAPESIFDDPDEAVVWATRAFEAALRGKKSTRLSKRR